MIAMRWSVLLIGLLVAVHVPVIFAGFFAPYHFAEQNREFPFAPPSRLHFVDASGSFHWRPFVYAWKTGADGSYDEDHQRIYEIKLFVRGRNSVVGKPDSLHLFGLEAPGRLFLLGTDAFGRDEFSRILYGGRVSLFAGFMGTVIALLVGTVVGIASGYYGKGFDAIVMRLVELFLALPWLYLLFAVRAVLPLRIKSTDVFLVLIGIVGLVGWAGPARLLRGIVLSARERNFVLAAQAMGASDLHILRWHVLPQTYPTLATMATLLIPQFILAEVTLSFLGLGVGEPNASWGSLLAELQKYNVLVSYWWMYSPAIVLVGLFLAYGWVSESLQRKFSTAVL
jgi:peptide/nickel transport system permease protein